MKKKDNGKVNHGQLTPVDSDAKKKMQFYPSLVTGQLLF